MKRTSIVVVGAGFGGLSVVRGLREVCADVTLVDSVNHHLFQPLLYQVATAALSPADIAGAIRSLVSAQDNVTVIMDEVVGVDTVTRQVLLTGGATLAYDFLVLATGSAYSYFGNAQWADKSMVLKTLDDATRIRSRLLSSFEWAESSTDAEEIERLLTFVVVGGGPTGVELAGNIAELARTTLSDDFRRIDPRAATVVLIEAEPRLLADFPDTLARYVENALRSLEVDVRCGLRVTSIDERGLTASDVRIDSENIFWAAGTKARPAAEWIGAKASRNGAIEVHDDCSIPGHEDIYAIGDCACQVGVDGKPLPGLAAVAKQQGKFLAKLLAARVKGVRPAARFIYKDFGTMAIVGRYRAVARLPIGSVSGPIAWLLWSLVHLILLMDFRSRLAVYFNWCWSWLTYGRGARLIMAPSSRPRRSTPPRKACA